jgi:hypothetical protein
LLLTLGVTTARADTGYDYAYAYINVTGIVESQYSLNPALGTVTAVHIGTGSYTVTFANSGIGAGWAVETTAYGFYTIYCNTDRRLWQHGQLLRS